MSQIESVVELPPIKLKTIMVWGETGSGKTQLISCLTKCSRIKATPTIGPQAAIISGNVEEFNYRFISENINEYQIKIVDTMGSLDDRMEVNFRAINDSVKILNINLLDNVIICIQNGRVNLATVERLKYFKRHFKEGFHNRIYLFVTFCDGLKQETKQALKEQFREKFAGVIEPDNIKLVGSRDPSKITEELIESNQKWIDETAYEFRSVLMNDDMPFSKKNWKGRCSIF